LGVTTGLGISVEALQLAKREVETWGAEKDMPDRYRPAEGTPAFLKQRASM
jgi:hypothetical protein